jgi:N-acyl-D-aspartate/D-glutamate deacylase
MLPSAQQGHIGAKTMHDIVIRGGTILDGTGGEAFTGDIAIDGGRLTAVGGKAGAAKREIEANGLLVTPGWVDVHTHYDGQATWDPVLAPSSWHGVTTILFGNCGVGLAPVCKEHREGLIDLMEAIEDIPGTALAEGLKWDWESFPEYLDALDRMPRTIDICRADPTPPAARLRDGRARHQPRSRDRPGHRGDAAPHRGVVAGGRVRLHDLAYLFSQDQ